MKTCKKCGNPQKMYWCKECESTNETTKCYNCGKKTTLDKDYHKGCDATQTEYDKVIDALNLIDEHAEHYCNDYDEAEAQERAYEIVADFIDLHAERQ